MQELSEYGYPFHKNSVLIIRLPNENVMEILQKARRTRGEQLSFSAEGIPNTDPEEIYFLSEDTWYSVRFHSFINESNHISLMIHGVKPMYMATAGLKEYRKIFENSILTYYSR